MSETKTVPFEPTTEMIDAGYDAQPGWPPKKQVADIYKAMLAAAPSQPVDGNTSDGYHTFNELYAFRLAYNAALFNEWARLGLYEVHKSERHHEGDLCFGGGWFIVVAMLPEGQISNHYKNEYWDQFQIPAHEKALHPYDGHTVADVLQRLKSIPNQPAEPDEWHDRLSSEGLINFDDTVEEGIKTIRSTLSQPADELARLKEAARYFIAEYDDDRLMDRFSIESNEARDALCDLVRIKDHE